MASVAYYMFGGRPTPAGGGLGQNFELEIFRLTYIPDQLEHCNLWSFFFKLVQVHKEPIDENVNFFVHYLLK